jgi:tRNA nucleotidyltransferase/poly(A) polymerase
MKNTVLLLVIITVFSAIFFAGFICLNTCFKIQIQNESLIITFVGILATFVVVSNYVQVVEIRNQFSEKVKTMEDKIKELSEIKNRMLEHTNSDSILLKVFEIEDKFRNCKTWEEKKNILSDFSNIIKLGNRSLNNEILSFIDDSIITYDLTECMTEDLYSFCISATDKSEENIKIKNKIAHNIVYRSIKKRDIPSAKWGLCLFKYIIKISRNNESIKDEIKTLLYYTENYINNENIDEAKKMVEAFKIDIEDNPYDPYFDYKI